MRRPCRVSMPPLACASAAVQVRARGRAARAALGRGAPNRRYSAGTTSRRDDGRRDEAADDHRRHRAARSRGRPVRRRTTSGMNTASDRHRAGDGRARRSRARVRARARDRTCLAVRSSTVVRCGAPSDGSTCGAAATCPNRPRRNPIEGADRDLVAVDERADHAAGERAGQRHDSTRRQPPAARTPPAGAGRCRRSRHRRRPTKATASDRCVLVVVEQLGVVLDREVDARGCGPRCRSATAPTLRPSTSTPTSMFREIVLVLDDAGGLDVSRRRRPRRGAPALAVGAVDAAGLRTLVDAAARRRACPTRPRRRPSAPRRGCPTSMPESTVAAARRTSPGLTPSACARSRSTSICERRLGRPAARPRRDSRRRRRRQARARSSACVRSVSRF